MSNILRNCFSEQLYHFTSLAAMYEGSSFPIFAKTCYLSFFLRFYLLLERGEREGERKGEKHQCVVASHVSRTGDLACNPGICPDWESNHQPFDSQAGTQSTELHQLGLLSIFLKIVILMGVKWYLTVGLIYTSLMLNNVEHLFMCH